MKPQKIQTVQWNPATPLANFRGKSLIMQRDIYDELDMASLPDCQIIVITPEPIGRQKILSAYSLKAAQALAQYEIVLLVRDDDRPMND